MDGSSLKYSKTMSALHNVLGEFFRTVMIGILYI